MGNRGVPRAEDGLAPHRRLVDAAGAALVVREWGEPDGRPLVFWHGLNAWGPLQLNEAGPAWAALGFRVIAPEAPGFAHSPSLAEPDAYRPTRLASLVTALAEALRVGRFAYVGWSWGATIGCHLAVAHPERLSALVLLDAGFTDLQDHPTYEEKTLEEHIADAAGQHRGFRFDNADALFAAARERYAEWTPLLEERLLAGMRDEGGTLAARLSPEAYGAAAHGTAVEPPSATVGRLAALDLPILVVAATATLAAHGKPALERFRAAVPRAEVVVVDSGHDLLADAPEETIRLVGEWLRAGAGSRKSPA